MQLHRRVLKRGFRSLNRTTFQIVNLAQLANKFAEPTEIGPEKLREAGLIRNLDEPVKILGDGELSVAHTVMVQACSKSARSKLEAAGGKVEII
jgi:large subunit ribosomal protein L15